MTASTTLTDVAAGANIAWNGRDGVSATWSDFNRGGVFGVLICPHGLVPAAGNMPQPCVSQGDATFRDNFHRVSDIGAVLISFHARAATWADIDDGERGSVARGPAGQEPYPQSIHTTSGDPGRCRSGPVRLGLDKARGEEMPWRH